jgi:2-C-methyl-D-erythritol 4-phosphate cytidylyltransferase
MNFAVILSGGIGTRMQMGDFPKQYYQVNGKMILAYTLDKFEQSEQVDAIVIVMAPVWRDRLEADLRASYSKLIGFAEPGSIRQESILSGIRFCMERSVSEEDKVIIHDGVRPLVSCALIGRCFDALSDYEACLPVIPATDTIYYSEDGKGVDKLLDRSKLFMGQSPETFYLHKYYKAHEGKSHAFLASMRGTTEIAYAAGMKICMIEGEALNFKITYPPDLERFRMVLETKDNDVRQS